MKKIILALFIAGTCQIALGHGHKDDKKDIEKAAAELKDVNEEKVVENEEMSALEKAKAKLQESGDKTEQEMKSHVRDATQKKKMGL